MSGLSAEMAGSKGLPFRAAMDGENVTGMFTGTVQLSSGKFAVVEKSHEFTLVPWPPVIDRQLGREVTGVVQGGSVSWRLGRQRGIGLEPQHYLLLVVAFSRTGRSGSIPMNCASRRFASGSSSVIA